MIKQIKKPAFIHRPLKKSVWLAAGLVLAIGGSAGLLWANRQTSDALLAPTQSPVDLISGQDWSHFTGATATNNGIQIHGLGRAIVNQNGSDNQTNPPVNVRGPSLNFSNNLKVDFKASRIPAQGYASFSLYGAVPIIYDEWRYQTPQLCINLNRQTVNIQEWNGRSDKPNLTQSWSLPVGDSAYVEVALGKGNNSISLRVNGQTLGSISAKRVFKSGNLWFGADNTVGNPDWLLKSLNAEVPAGSKVKLVSAPGLQTTIPANNNSLRQLATAGNHPYIGAAIANYALFSDAGFRQLTASQINMLVPENELKAQFTEPQPDVYTFTDADNLVDFALASGMVVHGHNLVFSEANPKWMQTAPLSQRQQIMVNHVTTEVSHFGNKIQSWDVVDEPLNDNNDNHGNSRDLRQNIWFAAMGEKYIDTAFNAAHSANPNAQLYLNEYGLEADGSRWDEFLSLVKRLQARNVPINGVGFQAHVYESGDEVDTATLVKHMQILAGMGLKVRVSEADVYGDNPQHQADQYAAILKACLESGNCTSFTMWGLSDRYGSTAELHRYPLSNGDALVWDEDLQAKPAYQSLQMALK